MLEAGEWRVRRKLLETVKDDPDALRIAYQGLAYRHRCAASHRLHSATQCCRERRPASAIQEIAAAGKHFLAWRHLLKSA